MNREQKSAHQRAFARYLRTGQRLTATEWQVREQKFNPYHDPENGRFTFAPGGSSGSGLSASLINGGKPYPARIDLRNGAKPYPARINLPTGTPQPTKKAPAAQKAPAKIRFHHRGGLDLSPPVIASANELSDSIRRDTGYQIFVTSGRRDEHRQAEAMYNNYVRRTEPRYANVSAEREIRHAFDRARDNRKSRNEAIKDMETVLKAQTQRNIFISRHMRSGAIDILKPPANILQAIRDHPSVQSAGVESNHIHIQFR